MPTELLGFSPQDALYHHRYKFMDRGQLVSELDKLYTNRDIVTLHIAAANLALEALDRKGSIEAKHEQPTGG